MLDRRRAIAASGKSGQDSEEFLLHSRVLYIEEGTSAIIENMKFGNLVQLFLEYKEFGETEYNPTTALFMQSQLDVIHDARSRGAAAG